MKPSLSAALAVAVICCGSARALEPDKVAEKVTTGLVVVRALGEEERLLRAGEGVVTGRGQVVTSCRVLAKAKGVQVRQQDITYAASLQHADVERDLCQLSAPRLPAPAVALGGMQTVRIGQRLYALSMAPNAELSMNEVSVSVLREYQGMLVIQTSAPASREAGGTALFDSDARLVGITSTLVRDVPNANAAIAADAISEIPKRAQEQIERQRMAAAARPAPAAASPAAPGARPFVAEWAARRALLEKSGGQLTFSTAIAILFDVSDDNQLYQLRAFEERLKKARWSNAYAMGTDRQGVVIWGGAYRQARPAFAKESALEFCQKIAGDSCNVVFVNGDFLEQGILEVANRLGAQNIPTARRAFLESLLKNPTESDTIGLVGQNTAGQLPPIGYSSIRP